MYEVITLSEIETDLEHLSEGKREDKEVYLDAHNRINKK